MSAHTPTPWTISGSLIVSGMVPVARYLFCPRNGECSASDTDPEAPTLLDAERNAELLVRAVNAHDALVAENARMRTALVCAHEYIVFGCDDRDGAIAAVAAIKAALAQAKGEVSA